MSITYNPDQLVNSKTRLTISYLFKQAARLLFISCLLVSHQTQAQPDTPCTNDSLKVETNDIQWTVIANNFGASNNVHAKIVEYQYNSLTGYDASWISYKTDWLQYTTYSGSNSDSFMTLRYTFKNCGPDTIRLNFLVRRDNYCDVTLDGNIVLMHDTPGAVYNNYWGNQIDTTLFLDTCTHNIDFKVFNRAAFTGSNGFGLFVAGWLTGKQNTLFTNAAGCENFACCKSRVGVSNIPVKEDVYVYPNPARETISVILSRNLPVAGHYVIQNYWGQTVMSGSLNQKDKRTDINIDHLASGMYLLRINGHNNPIRISKQ